MSTNGARYYTIVLLVLISLTFVLIGLDKVNEASDPGYEDTTGFLAMALYLKDSGGITNFLHLCFSGEYKSVIKHPLYPLLLSTFASREPIFFERAKLLSLFIGWMVVIALFYVTKDLYGGPVAYIASVLLIVNTTFLRMSSHVACETLLIFFIFLSVYWMVKGLDNTKYWIWAGISGGLAYMTKGTGLLLIPIFATVAFLSLGAKPIRTKHFWIFFVLFFITCSPLIVRNIVVYKHPLYESILSNQIWMDDWRDMNDPKYASVVNYPEMTWEGTALPTMQSYFQTHTFSEIIQRIETGIRGESVQFFGSMDTLFPLEALHFLTFLFFCVGLILETGKKRVLCVLIMMGVFFIPFAWFYVHPQMIRYISPLIPFFCMYSAVGFAGALGYLDKEVLAKWEMVATLKWLPACMMVLLVFIAGYVTMTQQVHLPNPPAALHEDLDELYGWLKRNVKHNDLVLGDLGDYLWLAEFQGKFGRLDRLETSEVGNMSLLNEFLRNRPERNETYVIINKNNVLSPGFLGNYFGYTDVDGIIETKHIEGWSRAYTHSKRPADFLIYRIERA